METKVKGLLDSVKKQVDVLAMDVTNLKKRTDLTKTDMRKMNSRKNQNYNDFYQQILKQLESLKVQFSVRRSEEENNRKNMEKQVGVLNLEKIKMEQGAIVADKRVQDLEHKIGF